MADQAQASDIKPQALSAHIEIMTAQVDNLVVSPAPLKQRNIVWTEPMAIELQKLMELNKKNKYTWSSIATKMNQSFPDVTFKGEACRQKFKQIQKTRKTKVSTAQATLPPDTDATVLDTTVPDTTVPDATTSIPVTDVIPLINALAPLIQHPEIKNALQVLLASTK